jgi:HSP20 family protein
VYETRDSIVVKVEVAGMVEDDFAITFAERTLVIAGVRHDPSAKLGYHQMEIAYGEFRTEVYIPEVVDPDSIEASYKDGFLMVVLPKPEFHRPSIGDDE